MTECDFRNPFKPGAGHMPPYLAGREHEKNEFTSLLKQDTILDNAILTGLRGVGKTVLLEQLKPIAIANNWWWVGTDLSESTSVSEENIAIRILTDLSIVTSNVSIRVKELASVGFVPQEQVKDVPLNFHQLFGIYQNTPGLIADKLKQTLQFVWNYLKAYNKSGLIFAYDEAQNLSDQGAKSQFPLSLLLDVFQSIQRSNIPFMLVLTGLPTLFPTLVESRTYAERMFRVLFLDKLNRDDSRDAVLKPIAADNCPIVLDSNSVLKIIELSGGYPYFIQFICREVYDVFIQQTGDGEKATVPVDSIILKLDTDFFSGRWARATDRQRQLLQVIAQLEISDDEFSVQEIVELSKVVEGKPFSSSHVNQMLASLTKAGLIYKNRYGKYSFAVPLIDQFILRQMG